MVDRLRGQSTPQSYSSSTMSTRKMRSRKAPIAASILTIILVASMLTAHQITTESGRIEIRTVRIQDGGLTLSGLLHIPPEAHTDPRPAVVVTHGISSTKEMVDGIALELARRGIVAMSVDLHGHGDSEGRIYAGDPSLGLEAAVEFIISLDFVDRDLIGVAGHSLGAGAARAVASGGEIHAVAFIAGGVGGDHQQEGALTATNPKNLLVAVGSHDVLFRIDDLALDLQPVFGVDGPVEPGVTYGDFQSGGARRLAVRPTTHLLEPMDAGLVAEVVAWFTGAFDAPPGRDLPSSNQIFLLREACLLIALVSLFGVTLLIPRIVRWSPRPRSGGGLVGSGLVKISGWRALLFWGLPGAVLFIPLMGAGSLIPFPPQLFGSSMAWWLLSVALVGLLLMRFALRRGSWSWGDLKILVASSFRGGDLVLSSGLIAVMYLAAVLSESFLDLNFRFFVPVLNSLGPVARVLAFPTYLPFFLAYFLVDGVYMFELRERTGGGLSDLLKALGIKLAPYLFALALQYAPMYALDLRLLPRLVGFIMEFVWGVVPILAVTTICAWWLHRLTGRIWAGALFNTLLTAWVSASLFPYGSLL